MRGRRGDRLDPALAIHPPAGAGKDRAFVQLPLGFDRTNEERGNDLRSMLPICNQAVGVCHDEGVLGRIQSSQQ